MRCYSVAKNPAGGKDLLTVHCKMSDMPFNLWRDVLRLAGSSYDNFLGHAVFEFSALGKINQAKTILNDAMWQER